MKTRYFFISYIYREPGSGLGLGDCVIGVLNNHYPIREKLEKAIRENIGVEGTITFNNITEISKSDYEDFNKKEEKK